MMGISGKLRILRPGLWYRNIISLVPLVLTSNLCDLSLYPLLFVRLVLLCMASSVGYVINDILDHESDKANPDKAHRPLVSGDISRAEALLLGGSLGCLVLVLSWLLSSMYPPLIMLNTALYSLLLRDIPVVDIISISSNYVFRIMEGYSVVGSGVDHNVILTAFFFAMLMSSGKRIGEYTLLGEKGREHRMTLTRGYINLLARMCLVFSSLFMLFLIMALGHWGVIISPMVIWMLYKYLRLVGDDPIKVRRPDTLMKDRVFGCLFVAVSLIVLAHYSGVI